MPETTNLKVWHSFEASSGVHCLCYDSSRRRYLQAKGLSTGENDDDDVDNLRRVSRYPENLRDFEPQLDVEPRLQADVYECKPELERGV